MMPLFETLGVPLVYVLILQPFYLLQILPFWNFLEPDRKKFIRNGWLLLFLLDVGLTMGLVRSGVFSSIPRAYWACGYVIWIPQFLLSVLTTRKYWVGHLFILSFRILLSSCFYTFLRHFFLYFWPERAFSSMYFWQILFYGAECLLTFPFVLRFLTRTFSHFREAAARRYWRLTALIPMVLAGETLYVSVYDSQERYFDLLEARILLLLVTVLIMASIRTAQQEVYDEISAREEKHQLEQQVVSAANYVKMSKESRQRLEAIYREKREHLDQLLDLVRRKDRVGVLTYIEELGEEFNSTKLPQYCRNPLINAALTVYLSRAREEGINVLRCYICKFTSLPGTGRGDPHHRFRGLAPGYGLQRGFVHCAVQSGGKRPDRQQETAGRPAKYHRPGPAPGGCGEYLSEESVRCPGAYGRRRAAGDHRKGPWHRHEIPSPVPG